MTIPRPRALLLALLVIAAVAIVAGCSNNDNNNGGVLNPPPKELDSGNIANGASFGPHTFATAGTFNYHCTIHGGMTGQVVVVAGAPATATVTMDPGNKFNPQTATVMPGGSVTWNNNGGTTHTVTSN